MMLIFMEKESRPRMDTNKHEFLLYCHSGPAKRKKNLVRSGEDASHTLGRADCYIGVYSCPVAGNLKSSDKAYNSRSRNRRPRAFPGCIVCGLLRGTDARSRRRH